MKIEFSILILFCSLTLSGICMNDGGFDTGQDTLRTATREKNDKSNYEDPNRKDLIISPHFEDLEKVMLAPNPLYAFDDNSGASQEDNKVTISHLPEQCEVSIYNASGTLVRKYFKNDGSDKIVWDLTNQSGVPIASGLYIIHLKSPDKGERILKWYGILDARDIQGF